MKKYTVRKKRTTRRRRRRQNKRNGGLVMPWSRSNKKSDEQKTDNNKQYDEYNKKFKEIETMLRENENKVFTEQAFPVLYGIPPDMNINIKRKILTYLEKEEIKKADTLLNNYIGISCNLNPDINHNPKAVDICIDKQVARIEEEL